jgi:hypothetical protein
MSPARESPPLSTPPALNATNAGRLTRGQVASRLGISVSTVRRLEGTRQHPTLDSDDVRWFDEKEVASLAAELVNSTNSKRKGSRNSSVADAGPARSQGEVAALVFERLEQRQSLPEIVIGLRVSPEIVRGLYDQWCVGLTEGHLRHVAEPNAARVGDVERVRPDRLASMLASLPDGEVTRLSIARLREPEMYGNHDFICVTELGGFHVSGPCEMIEILSRHGPGGYRITAYCLEPAGVRWEVLVEGLRDG